MATKNEPTIQPSTNTKCPHCRGDGIRRGINPQGDFVNYFCECPAGPPARAKDREHTIARTLERSDIPLRFWDCTLNSSPLQDLGIVLHQAADSGVESYFFHGPVGVGKTGLAVGYAKQCVESFTVSQVRFVTIPRMLSRLRSTYDNPDLTEEEVLREYTETELLILDDMGAEQVKNTGWVEDRLYQIIGERHDELLSTIFTSNLTIAQLAERIGERITWRIVEMCGKANIVEITGPNLRDQRG